MSELPVAIIGAGPVGLAAAAHIVRRGLTPLVLERGPAAGNAVLAWGHVSVFSPWRYNVDDAARVLLETAGWEAPDPEALPTGSEIVRRYLEPLAAHKDIAPHIVYGAEVHAIGREGFDKLTTSDREAAPFLLRYRDAECKEHRVQAQAVIDASGTWFSPNPMGIDGMLVEGEREASERIAYGIPNVLNGARASYAGSRVLVVGSGHSAMNVVLDLVKLREMAPDTRIQWGLRRNRIEKLIGGGINDQLPARGDLGIAAMKVIEDGDVEVLVPFAVERIARKNNHLEVAAQVDRKPRHLDLDRIVVATGFRPEIGMLRELRVALDPVMEAPPALAPLIDPNVHSCGTVPPHGAVELAHPEPGFYIVGSKSYGRAPTFLMATGYEQVRSVVAEIAGDHEAARRVELMLPETGVCSATPAAKSSASACCGGPVPHEVDACCADDATAKASGEAGCGCGPAKPVAVPKVSTGCCARTA